MLFIVENLLLSTQSYQSPTKESRQSKDEGVKSVEDIDIYEYTYSSLNGLHFWKKREVALNLIGSFAEDISMFRLRNPEYNLKALIEQMMKTDFTKAKSMSSYLKGRTLWCAANVVEIIPKDYKDLIYNILNMAIQLIQEEKSLSVKLVATRVLVKYSRKITREEQSELYLKNLEQILDNLSYLLDNCEFETIHLPIDAITQFSKINE